MLGSETKQKIQNLRDTLVGKIPVPTEQVKQITLGLIYKFMSDIDQENKELGSKSFFRGDYGKYSWHKILDRGLSSYDRVLLYSEGLEKMALNPNIPQLFRDIFKGAFLPFRDPAIVNEFLKGINEFKYEHSEDLGDAFEFLLMVMDAQGDAGQFRTPRHIIDFIVQAVDPQKTDKILDPACGTAGFLVGAYKHILKRNTAPNSNHPGSALTTTQRNNLSKNFVGYDISHDMVRLSLVNMYLHQFSDPKIYEYDTLTSLDRWEDNFDCILANPPFMTPRGGIRPHNRFAIRANRSEVLFVDYIVEHLTPSGKAGIIVPEGIIFQSANAYKALRKMLVDNGYLYAVVSLPAGVFNPYSGVKTSILLVDKTLAKKAKDILFVKIESDGFDLGAQRRPIGQNDLPKAVELIAKYKQALIEEKEISFIKEYQDFALVVDRDKIAKKEDYILSSERYKEQGIPINRKWPMIELGKVCDLGRGFAFKSEDYSLKGILNFRVTNIGDNGLPDLTDVKYLPENFLEKYKDYQLEDGDFVIVMVGATTGKIGLISRDILPALLNQNMWRFFPDTKKLLKRFLYYLVHDLPILSQGGAQGYLKQSDFLRIKIPLPPLEVQQEIVTELGGYQKIIDGAKQVVRNYKPRINIDPDWKKVKFVEADIEIIDGDRGINYPKKEDFSEKGYCLFLNTKNVRENGFNFEVLNFITKEKDKELRKGKVQKNDLVLTTRGTVGNIAVFDDSIPFEHIRINSGMVILRPDIKKIFPHFLFSLVQTGFIKEQFQATFSGSAQPQLPIRSLIDVVIVVPPLETQKQIVAQIEEEQKLVEMNKKLIEIFEQKIKDKIKEIWGE